MNVFILFYYCVKYVSQIIRTYRRRTVVAILNLIYSKSKNNIPFNFSLNSLVKWVYLTLKIQSLCSPTRLGLVRPIPKGTYSPRNNDLFSEYLMTPVIVAAVLRNLMLVFWCCDSAHFFVLILWSVTDLNSESFTF